MCNSRICLIHNQPVGEYDTPLFALEGGEIFLGRAANWFSMEYGVCFVQKKYIIPKKV